VKTGDLLEQVVLAGAVGVTSRTGLIIGCCAVAAKVLCAPPVRDAIADAVRRDPDLGRRAGGAETGGPDRVSAGRGAAGVAEACLTGGARGCGAVLTEVGAGGHAETDEHTAARHPVGGDRVNGADRVGGRGGGQDTRS